MEKSLSERTARAVKQLRDNKAGFASKAAEAEEAVRYKAQGEALLQNRQVGNSQSIQSQFGSDCNGCRPSGSSLQAIGCNVEAVCKPLAAMSSLPKAIASD